LLGAAVLAFNTATMSEFALIRHRARDGLDKAGVEILRNPKRLLTATIGGEKVDHDMAR